MKHLRRGPKLGTNLEPLSWLFVAFVLAVLASWCNYRDDENDDADTPKTALLLHDQTVGSQDSADLGYINIHIHASPGLLASLQNDLWRLLKTNECTSYEQLRCEE